MTKTVTLDELGGRFADLVRTLPPGTKLRVTDGGVKVAVLSVTQPETREEKAASDAQVVEVMRKFVAHWVEAGVVLPEGDPLRRYLPAETGVR